MTRRFAILKHDHPFLHWDFFLESEASLITWRLLRRPCLDEPIAAEPLPEHRLLYLDYEGPVSGNRGSVQKFCEGQCMVLEQQETKLRIRLSPGSFAPQPVETIVETLEDGRVFFTFRLENVAFQKAVR